MPYSPYFGPGWWATLQLAAHGRKSIEHLTSREARWVYPPPKKGTIRSRHAGLGLGGLDAIDKFRVG
jgi:hypothetical protein